MQTISLKFLAIITFCILAASAAISDMSSNNMASININTDSLINAIVITDYDAAVAQALQLEESSKGTIIEDAVNSLIKGSKRNVLEFAYKLWTSSGKNIVKSYFPIQFRQILSENDVKIINVRDNLAIKLGAAVDEANDRTAYGDADDKTSDNVRWKLSPLWENNRVYFKIFNVRRHQTLKLGTAIDYAGDHAAYGSDDDNTYRHQWYLQPAKYDDRTLFFIYNRQYNQALKLSRAIDYAGDRQLFSHDGRVEGQPEHFGWSILPFN